MSLKKTTKKDVINWLQEQLEKSQGKFMDAEEAENNNKMHEASDEEYYWGELIESLEKVIIK